MAGGVTVRVVRGSGDISRRAGLNVATALHKAVVVHTAAVHREVVTSAFGGRVKRSGLFNVSAPGNKLANRTGHARSRITSAVYRTGNKVVGAVGSPDRYVLWNEVGAVIHAKGGALTIPTKNVQTATGATKGEWAGVRLRDVWRQRKLFVLRRKAAASAFVARHYGPTFRNPRTGRMERKAELLFLLVRTANIPARHMLRTVARRMTPRAIAGVGNGVRTAVELAK